MADDSVVRKRGSKQERGRWGSSGRTSEHKGLGDAHTGKGQANTKHASKTPPFCVKK